jgi:hypothetical protein
VFLVPRDFWQYRGTAGFFGVTGYRRRVWARHRLSRRLAFRCRFLGRMCPGRLPFLDAWFALFESRGAAAGILWRYAVAVAVVIRAAGGWAGMRILLLLSLAQNGYTLCVAGPT